MPASPIDDRGDGSVVGAMRAIGRLCAGMTLALGGLGLLGWGVGSRALKTLGFGSLAAKPNTLLGMVLFAGALLLADRAKRTAKLLAIMLAALALLTALEWLAGWDLGIDRWLLPATRKGEAGAGRMAFVTAVELMLLAVSFLTLTWNRRVAQWLATAGVSISGVTLLGYTFGAHALYDFGFGTHMAPSVAWSLTLLFAAVLMRSHDCGWVARLAGRYAGGAMLRRALPFAVVAPWAISWLAIAGSRAGLYGYQLDQVLTAGPLIVLSVLLLFGCARALDRLDREEQGRRGEIETLNRELEARVIERTQELLNAKQAVESERKRFFDALENLPAMICLLDRDYGVRFVNRAFREKFGEAKGRPCYEYVFGQRGPCQFCQSYRVLETGRRHRWQFTCPDGMVLDIHDMPFTDVDHSPMVLEMDLDITEHRRLEQELSAASRYTRSLIEASLDPLVTISKEGKIMDVNAATESVTGVPRDELIGSDFCDYFIDPAEAQRGYQQVFETGWVRDYPLAIRHRDGRRTEVLYNATVFRNEAGAVDGVFAAARDITERQRAERALQDSEQRYRSLVVATAQIVWTTTPEGEVHGDMPMWRAFTGQSEAEIQGWGWIESLHPDDRGRTAEVWSAAVKNRTLYETEYRIRRRDGEYRDVWVRGVPVLDAEQQIREWVGTCTDISERKRAEQELHRLNRALRTLSRCTEAVARAREEEALLRNVCDIVVQDGGYPLAWVGYAENDVEKTVRPAAVAGAGADYVRHARITWADSERGRGPTGTAIRSGAPCYVPEITLDPRFSPWRQAAVRHGYASVLALPLVEAGRSFGALNIYAPEADAFEGEEYALMLELASTLTHGILALRARQERDRAAAELRELNETLERRVAQRTAELTASTEEMESFTYSVSHDLRSPLRHIDGFSKVLLEQYGGQVDEQGLHYLERVRQGTQRMGQLVDDLLNLSRLGRRALQLRPVGLGIMVREVMHELRSESGERDIEWHIGSLPTVTCDPGLIRQVLLNLLSNAIKFTRDRQPATIEVGVRGPELFVRDNGVGFDPQYAGNLFGVFQRLHRSEEFPGNGVGLAMVRRILRRHGGDIRAEAAPDAGATFYFTVEPPGPAAAAPVREEPHAA